MTLVLCYDESLVKIHFIFRRRDTQSFPLLFSAPLLLSSSSYIARLAMKMEIAQGPILGLLASRVLVLIVGKDRSCYYPAKVVENQIGDIYFFGFSMVCVFTFINCCNVLFQTTLCRTAIFTNEFLSLMN